MRYILTLLCFVFVSDLALAQLATRTGKLEYVRGTVGATAADAVTDNLVAKTVYGWSICHDPESAADWLAFSENADPATDGRKLGAGQCFDCVACGGGPLRRMQVKASAAGVGYSVIMQRP